MGAVRLVAGGRAEDVPRPVLLDAIRLACAAIVAGGFSLTWLGFRHGIQVRTYSIDRKRMPNTLLVCKCLCACVLLLLLLVVVVVVVLLLLFLCVVCMMKNHAPRH